MNKPIGSQGHPASDMLSNREKKINYFFIFRPVNRKSIAVESYFRIHLVQEL
jgi:hypothetical protein